MPCHVYLQGTCTDDDGVHHVCEHVYVGGLVERFGIDSEWTDVIHLEERDEDENGNPLDPPYTLFRAYHPPTTSAQQSFWKQRETSIESCIEMPIDGVDPILWWDMHPQTKHTLVLPQVRRAICL